MMQSKLWSRAITPYHSVRISRNYFGRWNTTKKLIRATTGQYETTTDPSHSVWNTDSTAKPIPYYEASGAARTDPGQLTIYDQPSLRPELGETWRATFKAFAVVDHQVLREVTWFRSQAHGEAASYSVSVEGVNALPEWAQNVLKDQGFASVP